MRNTESVPRIAKLILAGAMVLGAGTAVSAQPTAVEAPTYTVGDQWRFTTGPVKVVAIDGDLVVRQFPSSKQCSECRHYSDRNSVLVKVTKADGTEVKHPLIGFRPLDFPLSVGKEWDHTWEAFNEKSNRLIPLKLSYRVLAYEDVHTKAGTLKAFKISVKRELQKTHWSASRPDWGEAVYWYSPQAKTIVKRQVVSTGAVREFGSDWELESFSVK